MRHGAFGILHTDGPADELGEKGVAEGGEGLVFINARKKYLNPGYSLWGLN